MIWKSYIQRIKNFRENAFPQCEDRSCTAARRLWRWIWWRNGRIRLQGELYCAPQCFERAAGRCFQRVQLSRETVKAAQHRIPLGLLLLSRGQLSNSQLRLALEAQRTNGKGRIGHWLESLGFATEEQITVALGIQWACPVLPSHASLDKGSSRLLPLRLLESFRMFPVKFVTATRIFLVAFCDGVDYRALYAIEQMLHCRTEACLLSRSALERALEGIGHELRNGDLLFESWRDMTEMARITCGYVLKLGAEDVRIVTCGEYIWVRLAAGRDFANILFRRGAESEAPSYFPSVDSFPMDSAS